MYLIYSLQSYCKKLQNNCDGNIFIMAAIMAFVLVGAAGVAIDISRAQTLKSRMQASLDASALATGQAYIQNCSLSNPTIQAASNPQAAQTACLNAVAQNSFNANFPSRYLESQPITITPNLTNITQGYINMQASTTQRTSILAIMGMSNVNVSVVAQVKVPSQPGQCPASPTSVSCAVGTPENQNAYEDPNILGNMIYVWNCLSDGISSPNCQYSTAVPQPGTCEPSQSCLIGPPLSGSVSTSNGVTTWVCPAYNEGSAFNAACSDANPICSSSTITRCVSGTYNPATLVNNNGTETWQCDSINLTPATHASCSGLVAEPPSCSGSLNTCLTGKAGNAIAPHTADDGTYNWWSCSGINGNTQVISCSAPLPAPECYFGPVWGAVPGPARETCTPWQGGFQGEQMPKGACPNFTINECWYNGGVDNSKFFQTNQDVGPFGQNCGISCTLAWHCGNPATQVGVSCSLFQE